MAFGQGVVVTGGYRSCPAVRCGATVTTAPTAPTSLFVALIRTYTLVHKRFACLCFHLHASVSICTPPCSLSPAVSKVGKPRWGHPLVDFVVVGQIDRTKGDWHRLFANWCMLVHSHTH